MNHRLLSPVTAFVIASAALSAQTGGIGHSRACHQEEPVAGCISSIQQTQYSENISRRGIAGRLHFRVRRGQLRGLKYN